MASESARILMLGWEYPPEISGGLGTACRGIVKALAARGTEIVFVAPHIDSSIFDSRVEYVDLEELSGKDEPAWFRQRIKRLQTKSALRPYMTEAGYADMLERLRRSSEENGTRSILDLSEGYGPELDSEVRRYASVVEVLATTEKFGLVHAHDWMTFPAALRLRKLTGVPALLHVHSLEVDRNSEDPNASILKLEKAAFAAADHVIAVSHYTKAKLVGNYDVPEWKITVVHNAVSRKESSPVRAAGKPFGEKLVLFLGRVTSQKGPGYFIDAAARVLKTDPTIRFVMAGSGDMLPGMIERAAEHRIGLNFHFTGFLRGSEVERIYAMSDLYVMPSVSEPFGISSLEAVMYDVPVIVSRQSGVGEILKHAVKVDYWNIGELADSILGILTQPALRDATVRMCSDEIAGVCWENAAEKIQDAYARVLAGAEGDR